MTNYKNIYLNYFGYGEQDYIPSELSGKPVADIHHIIFRSKGGTDDIKNLIALTRDEHDDAHDRSSKLTEEYLTDIHLLFMKSNNAKNKII